MKRVAASLCFALCLASAQADTGGPEPRLAPADVIANAPLVNGFWTSGFSQGLISGTVTTIDLLAAAGLIRPLSCPSPATTNAMLYAAITNYMRAATLPQLGNADNNNANAVLQIAIAYVSTYPCR